MNLGGDLVPIVILGESPLVEGFALGGAEVIVADDPESVLRAWVQLPDDAVVVLTAAADRALREGTPGEADVRRLRVVMPQ